MNLHPSIQLSNGHYFNFESPEDSGPFGVLEIATALSKIARFGGHTEQFYSVAQHSVIVSMNVPAHLALDALFHDAAEAFVGDIPSPLKQFLPEFAKLEKHVAALVRRRLGLREELHPLIKIADLRALSTEKRDLMPSNDRWSVQDSHPAFEEKIRPLTHDQAELYFLLRYSELSGQRLAAKIRNSAEVG